MFSRRDIQQAVNELANVRSARQLNLLVQRLNSPLPEQIAAEWEAVVVAAAHRVTILRHEYDCGGSSRPDILARADTLEFVADVCTVSDTDIEDDNPVDHLQTQIYSVARSLGLPAAGLFLDVERLEPSSKTQRKLLALPAKGDVQRFVATQIRPFLERVAKEPSRDATHRHDDEMARLTLRYVASEKVMSGGTWPRKPSTILRQVSQEISEQRPPRSDPRACSPQSRSDPWVVG